MRGRIPRSFIQDIVSRTDIIELIQARVTLKKRGNNYLGLCPFHSEKTPSFTVSADKQFYYCFGCGAYGNVIDFLINFDRMNFVEAVTDLAHQLGLEVPTSITHEKKSPEAEDYYALLNKVSHYYQSELRRSPTAINYLKSRGLTGEIAKQFAIGFAPPAWENLHPLIKNPKIKSQLITNGLLIQKGNRCFDRFRHRIMFPIRDVRGRIIAFGGRALGDEQPKYMNSPETPIFHKGNELYGLYEALKGHRQLPSALIVEGYMDVVSLHQHQITYAVATLGTATSARHLQKLLRYTHEIIYCFDGDEAGRRAAWRALTESLPLMRDGIQIRFLFLPQGEDPDSLVRKIGRRAFEGKIKTALPLSDVFFSHLQQEIPIHSIADKANFANQALEYLNKMPKGLFHQFLLKALANRLAVDIDELDSLSSQTQKNAPQYLPTTHRMPSLAHHAISMLAQAPSLVAAIEDLDIPASNAPEVKLLSKLVALLKEKSITSTGELLALWPDQQEHRLIADLATHNPHKEAGLSEVDLAVTLKDAIQRLYEQHEKEKTFQSLIQQSKHHGPPK